MDWADDTAYSLNDLVDGINVGFITLEKIERWASEQSLNSEQSAHINALMNTIRKRRTEPALGKKIGAFITAARLVETDDHPLRGLTNRCRFKLEVDAAIRDEAKTLQAACLRCRLSIAAIATVGLQRRSHYPEPVPSPNGTVFDR